MKILIVDTYYKAFLDAAYSEEPALKLQSFESQRSRILDMCFGTSDF